MIKRYAPDWVSGYFHRDTDGGYVLFEDHESEVNELKSELEALREQLRWRDVREELPDCDVNCLVGFGEPDIDTEIDYMDYEVEYGTQYWANCGDTVTHWMPLPTPPTSQSNKD